MQYPTRLTPTALAAIDLVLASTAALAAIGLTLTRAPSVFKIVFCSDRDGDGDIYTMNADGSGVRRITNSESNERDTACSPDGLRVAFSSDRDGTPRSRSCGSFPLCSSADQSVAKSKSATEKRFYPRGGELGHVEEVRDRWVAELLSIMPARAFRCTRLPALAVDDASWFRHKPLLMGVEFDLCGFARDVNLGTQRPRPIGEPPENACCDGTGR
jgi:hypothetical protein